MPRGNREATIRSRISISSIHSAVTAIRAASWSQPCANSDRTTQTSLLAREGLIFHRLRGQVLVTKSWRTWTMCSWAYGVQSYGRRSSGLTACSNPTPMHLVGVSLTSAVTKSSPHSQSKIEEAIVVLGCAARQPPHVRYTRLPTYCVASGRCHGLKPSIGMLLAMGCIAALSDGNRTRRNEIATR